MCALIFAKWFAVIEAENQGWKESAGIGPVQLEGQNLNSLLPLGQLDIKYEKFCTEEEIPHELCPC